MDFLTSTLVTLSNLASVRPKGYEKATANGRSIIYNFNHGAIRTEHAGHAKVIIPHACGVPAGEYRLAELALGVTERIENPNYVEPGLDRDDYVALEKPFTLDRRFVKTAIKFGRVSHRPHIEGVFIDPKNIVFTNGHMMLLQRHGREMEMGLDDKLFIPVDILKIALKIFKNSDIQVARLPMDNKFPKRTAGVDGNPVIEVTSPLHAYQGTRLLFEYMAHDHSYVDYHRAGKDALEYLKRGEDDKRNVKIPTLAELVHQEKLRAAREHGAPIPYTALQPPIFEEYNGKKIGFSSVYLKVLLDHGITELAVPAGGDWGVECYSPCAGSNLQCHPFDGLVAVLMPMRK